MAFIHSAMPFGGDEAPAVIGRYGEEGATEYFVGCGMVGETWSPDIDEAQRITIDEWNYWRAYLMKKGEKPFLITHGLKKQ